MAAFAFAAECGAQRVVSYNVGAFRKWGGNSYALVASIISDAEPDFVALQEVDSCTVRTKGVNQAERVCEELNALPCTESPWKWAYCAAMPYGGGGYGNAVLYRGEAVRITRIAIPKGSGSEPRCCVAVETQNAVFASVHLDHKSSDAALAGAKKITSVLRKLYSKSEKPVILCGDFNSLPESATVKYMSKKWIAVSAANEPSYPCCAEKDATDCIDYVWVLKNKAHFASFDSEVASDIPWRSVRSASDHYPLAATITR